MKTHVTIARVRLAVSRAGGGRLVGVAVVQTLGALHVHKAVGGAAAAVGVAGAGGSAEHTGVVAGGPPAGWNLAIIGGGAALAVGGDAVAARGARLPVPARIELAEGANGGGAGGGVPAVAGGREALILRGGAGHAGHRLHAGGAACAGDGGGAIP